MELSFKIALDHWKAWEKYGRTKKAWFAHAWFGRDDVFNWRLTTGFRLLGFSLSINLDL